MTRVYVDTNIFLYAIGTDHRYRAPCRELVRAMGDHTLRAETSVETVQEIVHHRRRRGDPAATERGRRALGLCEAVHPLDTETTLAALDLIDLHPDLSTRDAMHAATARTLGIRILLSADSDFDAIGGLERIDPLDRAALGRATTRRRA